MLNVEDKDQMENGNRQYPSGFKYRKTEETWLLRKKQKRVSFLSEGKAEFSKCNL